MTGQTQQHEDADVSTDEGTNTDAPERITGILEWNDKTEGRLRTMGASTALVEQREDDPFVPLSLGEAHQLREGLELTVDVVSKKSRRRSGKKGPRNVRRVVDRIVEIEGLDPGEFDENVKPFESLSSVDPSPRYTLEHKGCPPSCRLIDLFCPIGRGQRGLIVAPPKGGKTTIMKDIAHAMHMNHPEVELIALLIDERPEEVTDFSRSTPCTVYASSNDHDVDRHTQVAITVLERAKRMVEAGKEVMILLDSLTRLGRAFNNSRKHGNSGRTLSGGIDARALEIPKRIFGAARNTEEAGALTLIASCLVDTGSQGDQVIFEEFKGTGNMELVLDRKMAEKRIFPAIDLASSGTRKEEKLLDPQTYKTVTALRKRLMNMHPTQQMEQLLAAVAKFETNDDLIGIKR